jgi:methylated-DNA-[protein]-cysteine S-methyltransferase
VNRRFVETTAGAVCIAYNQDGLFKLSLPGQAADESQPVMADDPAWVMCFARDLQDYFNGHATNFSCPLDFSGYGPFFRSVLLAAAAIPFGERRSYRWLAEQAGSPRAARAAGQAMASNRTPLVIPCHRVVRTDGAIGGFSGGPGWKEKLLELEKS